jgi:hypothetical protein
MAVHWAHVRLCGAFVLASIGWVGRITSRGWQWSIPYESDRWIQWQTNMTEAKKWTNEQTNKPINKQRKKQTNKETNKQTNKQTPRKTNWLTNRNQQNHTQKETKNQNRREHTKSQGWTIRKRRVQWCRDLSMRIDTELQQDRTQELNRFTKWQIK